MSMVFTWEAMDGLRVARVRHSGTLALASGPEIQSNTECLALDSGLAGLAPARE
jgi:hypothetical protein